MKKKLPDLTRILKASLLVILFTFASTYTKAQNCTVNANVDQTICATVPLTLVGATGGLTSGGTVWSQVSGPSVTIVNPSSLTTAVTGYQGGTTYRFRLTGICEDGSLAIDEVNYIVNPPSTADAGPDQASCPGNNVITLAANALSVNETGKWTIQGTNNGVTIINTTSPTSKINLNPGNSGNTTLRWTVTNSNGCTAFDDVIITNYGAIPTISAGTDKTASNCYSTTQTVTMTASFGGLGAGGQIGKWTVISGPNIPTIAFPNRNNSNISNLIQGTYTLRWTVSGPCANGSDDVQIFVPAPVGANTAAKAGPAQNYCDGRTNITLTGNAPTFINEFGQWSFVSGPTPAPVITNPNSRITTVTNVGKVGTYRFRWTIRNIVTGCTSSSIVNVAFVNAVSSFTAGADQNLGCGITSTTVNWSSTGGNLTRWRILSGPANPNYPSYPTSLSGGVNSPTTIGNLTTPGTYVVEFQRSVGSPTNVCSILTDQVNITTSATPTNSNAGSRQILACNVITTGLAGNAPIVGAGSWSQVVGPNSATLSNPLSPTSLISGLIPGVYTFRWLISGGAACSTKQSDASVIVSSATPSQAVAGPDQNVCYGTPAILSANNPLRRETGTWSVSPSSGVVFSNINSPSASVTGLAESTIYTFTWTISNACGSTTDQTVITTSSIIGPTQSDAGIDQCQASGTTSITLSGNNVSPETGLWTKVSGGSATITSPGLFNTTVTGLSNGIYLFEWATNLNGCTVSRDTMMVTISAPVTNAIAGANQNICGTSATFSANTPVIGTGEWSQVSGAAGWTITDVNSPTSTITGLNAGVYVFRWTISNGSCPPSTSDVTLNVSLPPTVSIAGPDQNLCGTVSTTLAANAPGTGSGIWSLLGGAPNAPTFSNINSPTSTISGLIQGTYTLRWTISSGGNCSASTDEVVITVVPTAAPSVNQTICDVTSIQLTGLPAGSTGNWTQFSGPNTSTITTTGPNTAAATGLTSGSYVFTYTIPAAGCSTSANTTVTIDSPSAIADAGPDQDVCRVGANVTVTMAGNIIAPSVGTWSRQSGPASPAITNPTSPNATIVFTTPGLYYYQWRSTNGVCSNTDVVKIYIYAPPTVANAGPDQLQVCGPIATMAGNNPTVGIGTWTQVSGPNTASITSPILYNSTMTGLIAGIYTFRWTITNGPCASSSDDVDVTVFTAPTTPNAGVDQLLCNAASTTLSGNTITTGTGLWSQLSGPNTAIIVDATSPTSDLTGLIPGVYQFSWTSTLLPCTNFDQVTITNYGLPTNADAGSDFSKCLFETITLAGNNPVVGVGKWTQIGTTPSIVTFTSPNSPTSNVTGVIASATPYVFRWTISNGTCTSTFDEVSVTINPLPSIANAGPDQTLSSTCGLTTVTLAANVPVVGTGNWSVVSGAGGSFSNSTSPTSSFTGDSGTKYILRWTISYLNCLSYSDDVFISLNSKPTINNITATTCSGVAFSVSPLDGTDGEVPPGTTYTWLAPSGSGFTGGAASSGKPSSITGNLVNTTTAPVTATYLITPTTENSPTAPSVNPINCVGNTFQLNVTINPKPAMTSPNSKSICTGNSVGLALTSNISSTYLWVATANANVTGESTSAQTGNTLNDNLVNNTAIAQNVIYTVTPISIGGNCTGNLQTVTITVNPTPATPTITAGGPLTFCSGGSVTLTSSAGSSYLWSTGETTPSITVSTSGSYTVQVTNASGCPSAASAATIVTVNPTPATPTITAGGSLTFCSGGSVTLTSSAGSSYLWSTGETTPSITVSTSGSYTVQVTNASGCQSAISAATVVTVNPTPATPTITAGGPLTFCSGGSVTLTSSAGSNYLWSTGETSPSITVSTSGSYTVQVTNASGCPSAASAATVVTVNPTPATPTITAGGSLTFCSGGSVTLTSSAGSSYLWSTGETSPSITVSTSGSYTVQVTNALGCQSAASAATVVTVNPTPATPTIIAGGPLTFCSGGSVTLTSSVGSSYLWSTGETTPSITVSSSGSYSVQVTNASGCQSATSAATVVTVNPTPATPTITAGGPLTFCSGGSVTLNSSAGSNYLWSTGETTPSITVSSSGSYSVQVTNASGCQSATSSATVVTVNPTPATPTITAGGPLTFCSGGSVTLTSSAGSSYLWSTGETTPSITVSTSGSYTVQVTNASGCQSAISAATVVTVNPTPATPTITAGGPLTFCSGGSVTLTSSAGSSYLWSTGETTPGITVSSSGSYSVQVTNASGCQSATSAATEININPLPVISIKNAAACDIDLTKNIYSVSVTVTSGTVTSTSGTVTYDGLNNEWNITSIPSGTNITLTVTDINGCQNTLSVTAPDCTCPVLDAPISGGDTEYCSGSTIPAISASILPGETVDWYSSPTGGMLLASSTTSYTPSSYGSYYAEARNIANSCKSSTRTLVKLIENPLPSAIAGANQSICYGLETTIGSAPVAGNSYSWTSMPAGFTSNLANPVVSPLSTTNYTLTETITATGCSASHSVTVTVNPLPVVSAPATVCVGSTTTLSPTNGGTWISSNPFLATVTDDGVVAGISTGSVSFTFTDSNTGCVQTTSSMDVNEKPVFTSCPSDISVNSSAGQCNAPVSYVVAASGVPTPDLSFSFSGATLNSGAGTGSGSIFNQGITSVVISATNDCGSVNCSFTVTVTDNEKPIISCPVSVTRTADPGTCGAVIPIMNPTATDNCSTSFTYTGIRSDALALSDTYPVGSTTITWTATDESGNISLGCNQLITVTDNEKPVIACPANIIRPNDLGACGATFVIPNPTAVDNCSSSFTYNGIRSDAKGLSDEYPQGITTVRWTATDASGNISLYCDQTVTITDTEKPVIICPANITQAVDFGVCGATVAITNPTATDNCSLSFTFNGIRSDALDLTSDYPVGTTTISWTATDASGNTSLSCDQTIFVTDDEKPIINCPINITQVADAGLCGAIVSITNPTATDNCSTSFIYNGVRSDALALSAIYPVGNTSISWTATDESGNTSLACIQTVNVTDNQEPVISCPADISVSANVGICGATVSITNPTATDNCSTSFTFSGVRSDALALTAIYPIGTTTISWTANDAAGNTSLTCIQKVTVADDQDPVITCPANVLVPTDAGVCSATVILTEPTATDNCSSSFIFTGVRSDFLPLTNDYPIGNTIISWTATDGAGNVSASCDQLVTVTDNEKPTITAPPTVLVNSDAGLCSASGVILGIPVTADNCSVASVTNDAVQPFALGNTAVTWTVTDGGGNSETSTQIVTVTDNQKPVISCPAGITSNVDQGVCGASVVLSDPSATDNCTTDFIFTGVRSDGLLLTDIYPVGTTTITWTTNDLAGNVSESCSQNVTITDNEKPVAICKNIIVNLDASGNASITAGDIDNGSTDNCGIQSVSASKTSFDCSETGLNNVTLTVTDLSGNFSTCNSVVTVTDTNKPSISVSDIIYNENDRSVLFTVQLSNPRNCDVSFRAYTTDGSATAGGDYTSLSPSVYTIPGGSTSVAIILLITDDNMHELTENFYLNLSNPQNCLISDNQGVCTILDNDGVPSVSIADAAAMEGSAINFRLSLSNPTYEDITLTFALIEGSASLSDYDTRNVSITIPAGTVNSDIPVATVQDIIDEMDENFTIAITSVDSGTVGEYNDIAIGTIIDDDNFPVAFDDASATSEDVPVAVDVLINDTFGGDGPFNGKITSENGLHGTVAVNNSGTPNDPLDDVLMYTPDPDYFGPDSFTYSICDRTPDCSSATVTITVTSVNDLPVANDDAILIQEDVNVEGESVAVNDLPSGDGDNVWTLVGDNGGATNGMVTMNADGTYTYIPNPNFNGNDSFTYQICDMEGDCDQAVVNISVTSLNDKPVAVNDVFYNFEDIPIIGESVAGNDIPSGDGGNVWSLIGTNGGALNGTVTMYPDGNFDYYPNPNFNGTETFSYQICDADGDCETAIVTIILDAVGDAPYAEDDIYSTSEDTPIIGASVSGNDLPSIDGGNRWTLFGTYGGASHGKVVMDVDGNFTYTPDVNFVGTDTFIYRICDQENDCSGAKVTITVTPLNDSPVAKDDINFTFTGMPVTGNVLTNDSDPDGDVLTINTTPVVTPSHGSVQINPDGTYTYSPNIGYIGTDSFTYEVCDNATPSLCDQAKVTVNMIEKAFENTAPIAVNDVYQGSVGLPVIGNVISNDFDLDGNLDMNSVTEMSMDPQNGTLTLNQNGTFTFTPNAGFIGEESFEYRICDLGAPALCDLATVTITILANPDKNSTFATDDSYYGHEEEPVFGNVLSNDYDPEEDTQTVDTTPVVSPKYGIVVLNPNGTFTYTPRPNFIGSDQFVYRVCDDGIPQACNQATVYLIVAPYNDSPMAEDDINTTFKEMPVSGNVLTNDSDPEGDPMTIKTNPVVSPVHGTVVIHPDGTYLYTPNSGFSGTDSFIYEVCDNGIPEMCDQAKVTIKVIDLSGANNAPVAINDAYQGSIGLAVTGNVISNDFDPDGNLNPNSVTLNGSAPASGTLNFNPDGTFTYVPEAEFVGSVSFDYSICDTGIPALCDVATVTIDIQPNPTGNSTFAIDDSFFGNEDHSIAGNVLANDYDPQGDIQTVNTLAVVNPKHGTVTINANGTFTYIPVPDYFGQDWFVYEVCDNGTPKACDQGTVYLLFAPLNDPPIASDDIGITLKDKVQTGNLLTNDNDPDGDLIVINTSPVTIPAHGTVVIQSDGSYIYTPNSGFIGTDSFVYEICDNGSPAMCDQATVTIKVIEPTDTNDAPVAVNDVYKGSIGLTVIGNVISNDFDPDGNLNMNSVTLVGSAPASGSLTLNQDGTFTYIPDAGFLGQVSFVYRICDLAVPALCDEATVTIEILANPTGNSTFAIDDSFSGNEDNPLSGNLLANDYDPEGDIQTVNVSPVVLPLHGSVTLNANGTFTYTPEPNFFGTDRFVYEVCDNGSPQACDVANVSLIILPGDDTPLAVADSYSTNEESALNGNVGINDITSNDGGNQWSIVQQPEHGDLVFNSDGSFVYTPEPDFNGNDQFVYKLCDADGDCTEATVTVTVNPENDLPVANDDALVYHLEGILDTTVVENDVLSGDGGNTWSIVNPPANGSIIFNPDGTFTYTAKPNFIGTDSFTYQLCDASGDCDEAKVTIDIADVVVPNEIFTPNGDGQNDTYHIEGIEFYPGSKLTIFNRWGNVVYQKSGYLNDWDGYSNVSKVGKTALPVGTYFYVLDYGKDKHKAGYVYLER